MVLAPFVRNGVTQGPERGKGLIRMMDRERTNRERERIFEATRQSYRTAMENVFALQERTLEIARSLLESSAEASRAQAERNRALLEELAEQSRRQREILENLLQETTNAYVNVLWAPFSYYQEVLEAMAPTRRGSPRSQESSLPIEDYNSLNVREVIERLDELGVEEIERLRSYEAANKNRIPLLRRFDARIEAGA
jgi:hypothetical protein